MHAGFDRPATLRLLEERLGGGPTRIGDPGLGSELRQQLKQPGNTESSAIIAVAISAKSSRFHRRPVGVGTATAKSMLLNIILVHLVGCLARGLLRRRIRALP